MCFYNEYVFFFVTDKPHEIPEVIKVIMAVLKEIREIVIVILCCVSPGLLFLLHIKT